MAPAGETAAVFPTSAARPGARTVDSAGSGRSDSCRRIAHSPHNSKRGLLMAGCGIVQYPPSPAGGWATLMNHIGPDRPAHIGGRSPPGHSRQLSHQVVDDLGGRDLPFHRQMGVDGRRAQ